MTTSKIEVFNYEKQHKGWTEESKINNKHTPTNLVTSFHVRTNAPSGPKKGNQSRHPLADSWIMYKELYMYMCGQACLHLLLTGNTKTPSLTPQNSLNFSIGNFYDNENLSAVSFYKTSLILIPTFLTLPSASTSGCENFSLKVFTPANLEESRAIAAILKSSNIRARSHPSQNHVT